MHSVHCPYCPFPFLIYLICFVCCFDFLFLLGSYGASPPCVRELITDVISWEPQACGAELCTISLSSKTSSSFSQLTIGKLAILHLQDCLVEVSPFKNSSSDYCLIYLKCSTSIKGHDLRPCLCNFALKCTFVKNLWHQMVI